MTIAHISALLMVLSRENGSSVARDETVREVAAAQLAGGALREVASQER
jgi:hypothetical protein